VWLKNNLFIIVLMNNGFYTKRCGIPDYFERHGRLSEKEDKGVSSLGGDAFFI
jgi:hypothetical protein